MQHNKNKLAISAAKLYYQSGFSQADIAKELQLSRPSVSRLLQYAKDMGFVRIEIFDPIEDQGQLAQKVASAYGLRQVCIANAPIEDEEEVKKYIGQRGAAYINEIIQDGDIIGVGWGTTLHSLSHQLIPHPLKGAQIVQLEGGITLSTSETYANEILENSPRTTKPSPSTCPCRSSSTPKKLRKWSIVTATSSASWNWGAMPTSPSSASVPSATTPYSFAWAMPIPKKKPTSRAMPSATSAPASSTKTATSPARN